MAKSESLISKVSKGSLKILHIKLNVAKLVVYSKNVNPSSRRALKLEELFKKLYFENFAALLRFAQFYCNDQDEASSAVQQVFLKVWERRDDLLGKADLKSYLFASVRNMVFNDRRKNQITQELVEEVITNETSAIQKMEAAELQQLVNQTIEQLPPRCRYIFELSRNEGMSYSQIATYLDLSVKTVENQMSKALKVLKSKIYGNDIQ